MGSTKALATPRLWRRMLILAASFGILANVMAQAEYGGTLRVGVGAWHQSLDPHLSISGHDRLLHYNIFNSLIAIDENLNIQPELATSWEVPDQTTVVLHLREGVVFHDGTPFDAEAVAYNFERMLTHPRSLREIEVRAVESTTVLGTHTIQINLSRPEAGFLNALADRAGMMVSPSAAEALGDEFEDNPVGTGPFKFVRQLVDDHVLLERFDDYWEEGLPYLDHLEFRFVAEEPAKVLALRSGDLDVIDRVPPQDIQALQRDPAIEYFEVAGTGTIYIVFNVDREPFGDRLVRQALSYAVDREGLIEALMFGQGLPARGPFAPTRSYTHHPGIDRYTYDPERAVELLTEAGFPDGLEMTIHTFNFTDLRNIAEAVQGYFADIGVEATVDPRDAVGMNQMWREDPQFSPSTAAWNAGLINPDNDLIRSFHSEGWSNYGHYVNPEVDALIDQILETYDEEERGRLYREVQEIIIEDAPAIFLVHPNIRYATSERVEGFVPMPDWSVRAHAVWLRP
jgi:peptide/nickel transport system substrate-binding protein